MDDYHFSFDEIPMFHRIRRWRVIASSFEKGERESEEFFRFCRYLAKQPPLLTLEVFVVMLEKPTTSPAAHHKNPNNSILWQGQIERIGQTLGMLRNVSSFKLRSARNEDPSQSMISRYKPWCPDPKLYVCHDEGDSFKWLVEGDTPVEKVFEVQSRLLTYAQAFERNPIYKAEMEFSRHNRKNDTYKEDITTLPNPFISTFNVIHQVESYLCLSHQESKE